MIDIHVSSVMTSPVRTVAGDASAATIAARFVEEGIGSLVVLDPDTGDMLGIVTESDLIRQVAMDAEMEAVPASTVMSAPMVTIASTETIATAAELMCDHSIRRIPVVDDGSLVGIVTTTDLAHYLPRLRKTILRERGAGV